MIRMVEFTYQMVLSTLQTIALIVGIAYYLFIMRNSQRNQELTRKAQEQALETRQTQLFMHFHEKLMEYVDSWREIMDEWSWNDYDDFMEKYGPEKSPEEWSKYLYYAALYEQMGILAKEGSVNVKMIYDWSGSRPISFWDKFEDITDARRRVWETPPKGMWLEYFEDLVYMLRDVREEDVRDFDDRLRRRRLRRQELGRTMPDYNP